ncbi:MAG: hypothetical protein ABI995_06035 [Acidobacteriota bacterium]
MFGRRTSIFCLLAVSGLVRAQPGNCVGSIPITTFRLSATLPNSGGSPVWMPLRQLNNLPVGYRIRYQPGALPADLGKDAALALLMVPKTGDGQVTVLDPGPAASSSEWTVPFDTSVVLLVFAPQGFDQKRLTNLMSRDSALISALVEYADQTNDLEATLAELSQAEAGDDAAMHPGRVNAPYEQAILALLRNLNPSASSFDPFGTGRRAGPTSRMGQGANLFFENAGGIVPGGEILPTMKQFLMPDTEFRSVYGAGADSGSMTLCAQRQGRTRNKVAYVWAYRLTNAAAPSVSVAGDAHEMVDVPIGIRYDVPLRKNPGVNWELIRRITDWGLVPESGGAPLHLKTRMIPEEGVLRLDLRGFAGLPGVYHVDGRWDWGTLRLNGALRLHALGNLNAAQPTPESSDKLIAQTGLVALELTGTNLLFLDAAWMHRPNSERPIAVDLPSVHEGPPDRLRVEVDTDGLHPGAYFLALSRVDGTIVDIPVRLLPPVPRIDIAGLRVNLGDPSQTVSLTGSGLERIEALESPQALIDLSASDDTRRNAMVRLRAGVKEGERLEVAAKVNGMAGLLHFPGVLQVAAARPRILEAKAASPPDLGVAVKEGEIPVGSYTSFSLRLEPAKGTFSVRCEGAPPEKNLPLGFTVAGPGGLIVSFDPATAGSPDCKLMGRFETPELGASDPFLLGTVIRLPRIEKFTMTNDAATGGYYGVLEGWDLETIERTGWNAGMGLATSELPRAIAGQGAKQTLRIVMPWPSPSPKAPLFVWLRGEAQGRATRIAQ